MLRDLCLQISHRELLSRRHSVKAREGDHPILSMVRLIMTLAISPKCPSRDGYWRLAYQIHSCSASSLTCLSGTCPSTGDQQWTMLSNTAVLGKNLIKSCLPGSVDLVNTLGSRDNISINLFRQSVNSIFGFAGRVDLRWQTRLGYFRT